MKKLLLFLTMCFTLKVYSQSTDSLEIKVDSTIKYISITDRFGTILYSTKVEETKSIVKVSVTEFISLKVKPPIYFINLVDEKQHLVANKKLFLPTEN